MKFWCKGMKNAYSLKIGFDDFRGFFRRDSESFDEINDKCSINKVLTVVGFIDEKTDFAD